MMKKTIIGDGPVPVKLQAYFAAKVFKKYLSAKTLCGDGQTAIPPHVGPSHYIYVVQYGG